VLNFEKLCEVIERPENGDGFLIFRQLQPSESILIISDSEIITDIIASKFHHWRGEEEPNGLTVGMHSNNNSYTLEHYKFYGFFDNSKIKNVHYKAVLPDEVKSKLLNAFRTEEENDSKFIEKALALLKEKFIGKTVFYYLEVDKDINEDLVAEWHVYDFFYAFIGIDKQNNIVHLIEYGLD
jgi:hypothetical protein